MGHACPRAVAVRIAKYLSALNHGVALALLLSPGAVYAAKGEAQTTMDGDGEHEHPKGALLFMLIYLLTLTALWLNAYARLWQR